MEITAGGDCGSVRLCCDTLSSKFDGTFNRAAKGRSEITCRLTPECLDGSCAPLPWSAAGISFSQQLCNAGICISPHCIAACLQQARSAGVRRAPGRMQAIAGVTSGSSTATINANWRMVFIRRSVQHFCCRCIQEIRPTRLSPRKPLLAGPEKDTATSKML